MSLVGTYVNGQYSIQITEANDANGQGKGVMTSAGTGINIPLTIHYHFENSRGPATNLWISGNVDDPNYYIGGAGLTDASNYKSIEMIVGVGKTNGVTSASGTYIRK